LWEKAVFEISGKLREELAANQLRITKDIQVDGQGDGWFVLIANSGDMSANLNDVDKSKLLPQPDSNDWYDGAATIIGCDYQEWRLAMTEEAWEQYQEDRSRGEGSVFMSAPQFRDDL
jgi:hypothetical protein